MEECSKTTIETMEAQQPVQQPPEPTKTTFLQRWLPLAPSATYPSLVVYLFSTLFTISFLVFLNAAQGFVLSTIQGVPASELGSISGTLGFVDQLVSLPFAWLWGVLSDRYIPRRIIYCVGFVIIGTTLFVYPNVPTTIPGLLLLRCFFAVGSAACTTMLTAVLSDFSVAAAGGRLAGLVGLTSGLGAIISLFVFLRIPVWLGGDSNAQAIRTAFYIVGSFALAWSVTVLLGSPSFFSCPSSSACTTYQRTSAPNRTLPSPIPTT
jgi:MFS family permease